MSKDPDIEFLGEVQVAGYDAKEVDKLGDIEVVPKIKEILVRMGVPKMAEMT